MRLATDLMRRAGMDMPKDKDKKMVLVDAVKVGGATNAEDLERIAEGLAAEAEVARMKAEGFVPIGVVSAAADGDEMAAHNREMASRICEMQGQAKEKEK